MNVNLLSAMTDDESLQTEIDEHQEIVGGMPGRRLTGRTILVSDADYPGAYRVYSEVANRNELWVWIDPEGNEVLTHCPPNDPDGKWGSM